MWAHVASARAARAPQSQVFSRVHFEPLHYNMQYGRVC